MARRHPGVIAALRTRVPRGTKLLLAVSGGLDSMCLLAGLVVLQRELEVTIDVAHVDHKLRPESGLDAQFVIDECTRRGIPVHVTILGPRPEGTNLEAWARESRYRYFKTVQREIGSDWILTAHHANDAAETLLMQLLSNKEPNGIRGIDEDQRLIRPLLSVQRADLDRFAKRFKIACRIDPTNEDETFLRNRIRKTLIPFLEGHFDQAIVASLADRALLLAEDERYLSSLATEKARSLTELSWGESAWVTRLFEVLRSLPRSLQWRFVEEILRPDLGFSIGARRAEEVIRFIGSGRGEIVVAGRLVLRWAQGTLSKSQIDPKP